MYKRFKQRVYEIIRSTKAGDKASLVYSIILCLLVIASSLCVILELIGMPDAVSRYLVTFEYVTVGIFALEYFLNLWVSDLIYPECKNKLAAMWEFITSFESLVDVLSIVSIVFNSIPKEFAVLRLIKLLKLARLAKMSGHIKSSQKVHDFVYKIQNRTNQIIDKAEAGDIPSKIFDYTITILIVISVSFIFVETFPLTPGIHQAISVAEMVIAGIFAVEYVLRVWTAPLDDPDMRPDKARMKYIFSFMSFIDILSIVPVFVVNLPTTTGVLKIFKLCKILRLAKASRYLSGIANFGRAIQKKKKQIVLSIVFIALMICICSVLMYSFENSVQPDVFENGVSGVWYCIQIMVDADSDIRPMTPIGQALSTLMLLLGGCMFGVPVTIVATSFEDMVAEQAGEEEEPPEAQTTGEDLYDLLRKYDAMDEADQVKFAHYISHTKDPE